MGLFWLRRIIRMISGKYRLNRIYLIPTYKCNQECKYCALKCYNGFYPKWNKEIGLLEWKSIIDKLDDISEIVISGGEPTLHPHFVDIVNHLSSKHLVYIYTNFTNLILWDSLQYSNNILFIVSLHRTKGFNANVFNHNIDRVEQKKIHYRLHKLGETEKIQSCEELYDECFLSSKLFVIPDGSIHLTYLNVFKYMEESK